MLKENIKTLRRSKGLSQEELAIKLNVVRQTVSKWEQGLSVPDADLLIALVLWHSPYLSWDYSQGETAVMGVGLHALEWGFVRAAPVVFAGSVAGAFLTRKKA